MNAHTASLLTLFFLSSVASLFAANAQAANSPAQVLPKITAQYETRTTDNAETSATHSRQWQMLRSTQRVEISGVGENERQRWQRGRTGAIEYSRFFMQQKRSVDYTEGDLRSLGRYPDWPQLSGVINPAVLQKLSASGAVQVLGRTAERYRGEANGNVIEVWWLADLKLPAWVKRTRGSQTVSIRLLSLEVGDTVQPAFTDTADFSRLDFADLGDMEADPLVQALHMAEGHHGYAR